MFGYACDETENYMPYAIDMVHKLAKRLTLVRKENILPYFNDIIERVVIPAEKDSWKERCEEILELQANGLKKRYEESV
mgnify:CR=1 FL=1